jgi:hypothetical protein
VPAPIQGRPATPPVVGLLASVTPIEEPDLRWAGASGWGFSPDGCDVGDVEDPCQVSTRTAPDRGATVEGQAFAVWASDRCSVIDYGGNADEIAERARRQLAAIESKRIASELWRGDLATAQGWPNPFLASLDNDVVTVGASSPTVALACLEQYLGECSGGARGMVHATRQVVTHWNALSLLRREGGLMLTINDTIVVPDAGYDGSGPPPGPGQDPTPAADGSIWAYATSLVQVRLGPVEVSDPMQVVDRDVNDYVVFAQRLAAVSWDTCCWAAAEVSLSICGVGGAGS